VPSPYRAKNLALIELLIAERARLGLLQKDLAAALGKPQSFIAKVEGGERRLDVAEFLDYAAALGIDPIKLLKQVVKKKT
jgi:transcriptional regulator with XRE-family HTH domain